MFEIEYEAGAAREIRQLRDHDRVRLKTILLAEGRTIRHLRVGDFRVFYDIEPEQRLVLVRAVRSKGRKTTGEIL